MTYPLNWMRMFSSQKNFLHLKSYYSLRTDFRKPFKSLYCKWAQHVNTHLDTSDGTSGAKVRFSSSVELQTFPQKGQTVPKNHVSGALNALEILTMTLYPGVTVMWAPKRKREDLMEKGSHLWRAVVAHRFVLSIAYLSGRNQGRAVKAFK